MSNNPTPDFEFIVLTPAGTPNPALAIAGSRAGALGILNLEFTGDSEASLSALTELAKHARGRFGVLLDAESEGLLQLVLEQAPPGLEVVALTASAPERLAGLVEAIHANGRRTYVVITNLDEARAGQNAGADALIAKGHEAGGWVGEETSFVLLQRLLQHVSLPVLVQGGVGLHTTPACFVGGAAGVVVDNQLLLTRETPLADDVKTRIAAMDGGETVRFGASFGAGFRAYARPGLPGVDELRQLETALLLENPSESDARRAWRSEVRRRVDWRSAEADVLAVGQDATFASGLARRFVTVSGILDGLREAIQEHCRDAQRLHPLAEDAPLAQSHGTRYPIVQGPMTRVSDRAEFAEAVAEGGALPFLALALMRGPEVKTLLEETKQRLGARPWGVGILGFVPQELRTEQLAVIRECQPPFALIAGGRPDQAQALERDGISSYLHVPSPGLLEMFLQDGARRFVFEGRECGGHVGPRTSFVLWETMVDVLLANLHTGANAAEYHVLFAGGVHDGRSSAMVATLAAPLVERGVRVGVLMGTAYLFTEEAVRAGAIHPGFQQVAVETEQTALVESGPGHATRCAPSPFVEDFEQEKRRLLQGGLPAEELRNRLEELNIGRLRVAAKGVDRDPNPDGEPGARKLIEIGEEEQWSRGMYMIGQVAALRDRVCTLAELHREVSDGGAERLGTAWQTELVAASPTPAPAAVAIVGMSAIVPGAPDLQTFWTNIFNKVDAITEVPEERWDWHQYFDEDRTARDKIYSRWGGFIDPVPFDPLEFGMPPNSLTSIEPFQLLALAVAREALKDAGYLDRPFPRERTSVMFGAGGGGGDLTGGYVTRSMLPTLFGESAAELTESLNGVLPEWTEDSFAGILMNVAAGRVANRLDLGGVNFTVDAACASSLAAVYHAVRDLEARTSDVVIVGGVDAIQNPFAFLCFSKTHALSPNGRSRPFDAEGDGIAISEGFAALVLKRLEDAERDGDRIYAVIRGVGGSSDGRDRSLTAPRPDGQTRALRRAYAQAGFSPSTVGLIEAHGTGTVAGDQAELQALTTFFSELGAPTQGCAVGSVKSMIGHTKATAGVAGLIKSALALHHRVLPPTLGVAQPNPKANFPSSPFYVNSETRPWVQAAGSDPRRAGVSAFGFGGTNFHVALEEYTGDYLPKERATLDSWSAELLVWRGHSPVEILTAVDSLLSDLEQGAEPRLADLAYSLSLSSSSLEAGQPTLAIVATSLADLADKLRAARDLLQSGAERGHMPQGLHYAESPLARDGEIAFLFPGQGSQYVNMARDIAAVFPEARASFDEADSVLSELLERPLSRWICPPPAFTPEEEQRQRAELTETNIAQPALGATDIAFYRLLLALGVEPGMVAGHSYGEFVALCAAGCFDEETLLTLSEARGRFIRESATDDSGTMAAVDAAPDALQELLADPELTLANLNAPRQTVVAGTRTAVERAIAWCAERGLRAQQLPVACAFHSPLVAPAQQRLAQLLRQTSIRRPRIPVFSNTTAAIYPDEESAIGELLAEHLVRPVDFVREIEAMYEAGARIFVEVGPRSVLTGLVDRILGDRPHVCVPLDQPGRPGLVQLLHGLATLVAEGVPLQAERLYRGRTVRRLDLAALRRETRQPQYSSTTWLVDGGRAWPTHGESHQKQRATVPLQMKAADGPTTVAKSSIDATTLASAEREGAHGNGTGNGQHSVSQLQTAAAYNGQTQVNGASSYPTVLGHTPAAVVSQPPAPAKTLETGPAVISSSPLAIINDSTPEVMRQFQQVMQRFLQTQQSVMLAYLGAPEHGVQAPTSESGASTNIQVTSATRQPITVQTPISLGAAIETNGMDTSSALVTGPPVAADAPARLANEVPVDEQGKEPAVSAPIANPASSWGREQITEQVLAVVSDRTGYPADMLGLDVDMEADLGIDSIKRVEIAGTVVRLLALTMDDSTDLERLTTSRTLRQVVENLEALLAPGSRVEQGKEPAVSAPIANPASSWGREQITEQVLAVVSDRTGYPADMLGLDVDMEADLGIDSIKRVEIAGTVVRLLALTMDDSTDLERLTTSRTLRQVVENLEALLAPGSRVESSEPLASPSPGAPERTAPHAESLPTGPAIGRFIVRSVPAPPIVASADLARAGVVLIVDDGTGVGAKLAELLDSRGHRTVRVVQTAQATLGSASTLAMDVSRPDEIALLADRLHDRFGPATALIHLAALRPGAVEVGLSPECWRDRLDGELRSLFLLAQAFQDDLERAAQAGGATVLAATAMGGTFATDHAGGAFFPGQGSIAGLLKTLDQEWPGVRVKAVDLSPVSPDTVANWLLAELMAADGIVEVGYRDGQRQLLELVSSPPEVTVADPPLDSNSVLLVTGGARGITAESALRLAERYRPTLLLVGRTPLPPDVEDPLTFNLSEPLELKRAIMEQRKQAGQPVTPAAVEEAYRLLLREREVRENLARLRQSGARIQYFPCDVRDAGAFRTLVNGIYQTHGRIDGVLHGAGVIEDKLIRDKRLDSFERVVQTKVDSALVLAEALRPESLRFLVFYSSVSGRFGNRGQADYAAASEVLNKLAQDLDRRWPGRVVSINWGPWLKTGMVSPEVQRQFAERGVALIPIELGCQKLDEELCFGRKGEVEVLIGGSTALTDRANVLVSQAAVTAPEPARSNGSAAQASMPVLPLLISKSALMPGTDEGVEIQRTLDIEHDLYLDHHRLDGRPVLPFAMAMELMAEVATAGWPDLEVLAVRQLRLLRGITLDGSEQTIRTVARPLADSPFTTNGSRQSKVLDLAITSQTDPSQVHYRAQLELGPMMDGDGSAWIPTSNGPTAALGDARPMSMNLEEIYGEWLFHGPLFQGIESIDAIGPAGAIATLRPSSPRDCLAGSPSGEWLIDPVVIDSGLQMLVIWARLHWDVTLLPSAFESYRRFGPLVDASGQGIRYELRIRPESQSPICHADLYFYTHDGHLLGVLTDMQGTGSKALNRLAGASRR